MLPRIQVASPCTADWDGMAGDKGVRHCAQCNLNVYNFAEMTSGEIEHLVAASKGQRLCGRLYRREDGTILTRDCPVGLRARIRRVSRRVGAALSAAMSVSLAAAQTPQREPSSLVQIEQAETGIHLVVFDESRAVIPKARVVVMGPAGMPVAAGTTNALGQIRFPALAPDIYELSVQVSGFKTFNKTVTVLPHQMEHVEATVQVGGFAMLGFIVEVDEVAQTHSSSDFQLFPESVRPNGQPPAPAAQKNPLRKFFRALGHALNP